MFQELTKPAIPEKITGRHKSLTMSKEYLQAMLTTSTSHAFFAAEGLPSDCKIVELWYDADEPAGNGFGLFHMIVEHPSFPEVTASDIDDLPALDVVMIPMALSPKEIATLKKSVGKVGREKANLVDLRGKIINAS